MQIEAVRGALRAWVLHRDFARAETGQAFYRQRIFEQYRLAAIATRGDTLPGEPRLVFLRLHASAIDAQTHRRMRIAGSKHRLPCDRVGAEQKLRPTLRMLMLGFRLALKP